MRRYPLIFTLDLEDHRPDPSFPKRYPDITRAILAFLGERRLQATVFVLGRVAKEEPALIREIASQGHEIAFHSQQHVHLTEQEPDSFRRETTEGRRFLEDVIGAPIRGYRAPAFSLTPKSHWAVDILGELGFTYSSSLLPAKNPQFGFPGAPRQPFRWANGLLEIPSPVHQIGPLTVPFLGGFYLRYLPAFVVKRFLRRGDPNQCYWAYCHPHDFDHEERFYQIDGTSMLVSTLLWFNRRRTFEKLDRIFPLDSDAPPSRSFAALAGDGVFDNVPTFAGP